MRPKCWTRRESPPRISIKLWRKPGTTCTKLSRKAALEQAGADAAEKATEDLKSAAEKAREELREAVREHADKAREAAREGLLSQSKEKDEPPATGADASGKPGEVEKARQEVRQMEQQLRQAMRRLQAIDPRSATPQPAARGIAAPPTEKPPVAPPAPPESSSTRPAPPAKPEPPAPPNAPRPLRRPGGFPGERLGPDMRRPGMAGPGGAGVNPRVERRLRDLEDKMDQLLKELDSLKGEQKDKDKDKKIATTTTVWPEPVLVVAVSKCEGREPFLDARYRGFARLHGQEVVRSWSRNTARYKKHVQGVARLQHGGRQPSAVSSRNGRSAWHLGKTVPQR